MIYDVIHDFLKLVIVFFSVWNLQIQKIALNFKFCMKYIFEGVQYLL